MSSAIIQGLAERLHASDPSNTHEQREIFERIRDLRSSFDGPLDPESHRCLEAAGMLVSYLARMGALGGEDVRTIAVRLLRSAADAEASAVAGAPAPRPAPAPPPPRAAPAAPAPTPAAPARAAPAQPTPSPLELQHQIRKVAAKVVGVAPARSATDLVGDMMLGQILLQRGHILDEHIHQAMKVQRTTSMRIGDIFVKIGACSRTHVAEALAYQASIRRVRENLGDPLPKLDKKDTRGTGLKLVGEAMLGEILIERGVITRRQLDRALEVQKQHGTRIGEALVQLGATTIDQIEQALRIQGRDRRFGTNTTSSQGQENDTGKGKDKGKDKKK